MTFEEFKYLWDKGEIKDKYSIEVEADYIEWEALEMEKKTLAGFIEKTENLAMISILWMMWKILSVSKFCVFKDSVII